jgi:hypothetical protein
LCPSCSPLYSDISSFLKKQFERDRERERERERERSRAVSSRINIICFSGRFSLSSRISAVFTKQTSPVWIERGNPELSDTVDSN